MSVVGAEHAQRLLEGMDRATSTWQTQLNPNEPMSIASLATDTGKTIADYATGERTLEDTVKDAGDLASSIREGMGDMPEDSWAKKADEFLDKIGEVGNQIKDTAALGITNALTNTAIGSAGATAGSVAKSAMPTISGVGLSGTQSAGAAPSVKSDKQSAATQSQAQAQASGPTPKISTPSSVTSVSWGKKEE